MTVPIARQAEPNVADGMKTCTKFGEAKPVTDFAKKSREVRRSNCYPCHNESRRARGEHSRRSAAEKLAGETRWRTLKQRYGITREQYAALAAAQGHACAMCGKSRDRARPLVVDHCHETNAVRGLLCTYCNVIVGIYENHRQAAAEYLATYGDGNPLLKQ